MPTKEVVAVGLLLNILACAIPGVWWPFFTLVAYFLAPMPNMICGACNRDDLMGNGNRGWKNSGNFLTGFFIVGGLAVPSILLHYHAINLMAFFLSLFGGFILYGTVLVYLHVFRQRDDGYV
eukprot:m51a1_g4385 hypothetical protein (122) ;mRNA; r:344352-345064